MAKTGGKKRKSAPAPTGGRPSAKRKKGRKAADVFEAQDSDPDEEKHAQRYDVRAGPAAAAAHACCCCRRLCA